MENENKPLIAVAVCDSFSMFPSPHENLIVDVEEPESLHTQETLDFLNSLGNMLEKTGVCPRYVRTIPLNLSNQSQRTSNSTRRIAWDF